MTLDRMKSDPRTSCAEVQRVAGLRRNPSVNPRGSVPDLAQVSISTPMFPTIMQPAPCSIAVSSVVKRVIANGPNRLRSKLSSGLTCDRDFESSIHCILKFLFASDVALSCLDRSVAKQKLNLFQFAS